MAISKVSGVLWANVAKYGGVSKANIANLGGQSAPSSFDYGNLVTDNLYQYYDVSKSNSYGGSGTAWNDIQGNYDLTLVGGPTYILLSLNISSSLHLYFTSPFLR